MGNYCYSDYIRNYWDQREKKGMKHFVWGDNNGKYYFKYLDMKTRAFVDTNISKKLEIFNLSGSL